jgi:hypothetical protein
VLSRREMGRAYNRERSGGVLGENVVDGHCITESRVVGSSDQVVIDA